MKTAEVLKFGDNCALSEQKEQWYKNQRPLSKLAPAGRTQEAGSKAAQVQPSAPCVMRLPPVSNEPTDMSLFNRELKQTMPKTKASGDTMVKERTRMAERIRRLGIPPQELTDSVTLALSALFEKLDDTARELDRARENFAELEQLVDVDCLAPVPNRRAFMRRLAWAISMHQRYNHPCTILYFDLNDFKQVNDTFGHAAGDDVIRHVSQILLDSLRDSDFMARLSGDEFAIIMYYAHLGDARERGASIAARLARSPVNFGAGQFSVSVACGAYEVGKDDTPESALAAADAEMYADKKRVKEVAET